VGVPQYQVIWTQGGTSTTQDLTDAVSLSQSEAIGASLSEAVLSFNNVNKVYADFFSFSDTIEIKLGRTLPLTSIFTGFVSEIGWDLGTSRNVSISLQSKAERLLNTMDTVPYSAKTASEIILDIITRTNSNNPGRTVSASLTTSGGFIEPSFKPVSYFHTYKPISEILKELSAPEFTGESGNRIFWVDKNNALHWVAKPSTVSSYLTEGSNIISMNMKRGVFEVVNALIVNGGADAYGKAIYLMTYDSVSVGNVGWRWKFKPMTKIADKLKNAEKKEGLFTTEFPPAYPYVVLTFGEEHRETFTASAGQTVFTVSSTPIFVNVDSVKAVTVSVDGVVKIETTDYTVNVATGDITFLVAPGAGKTVAIEYQKELTVANDAAYNSAVRNAVKAQAKSQGDKIISVYGNARYVGSATIQGTIAYTVGDNAQIIAPSLGWTTPQTLRITDLRQAFSKAGWKTQVKLEEDEEVATID
jgi:hypothetical protein